MSSPVTVQASKVWQLLTASSTANSYKQAIEVTGTILKETTYLFWLVFCLVLVAGEWLWHRSISTGRSTRAWIEDMGKTAPAQSSDPGQTASQMWQNLLTSTQSASQSLLAKAKQQLDLPSTPVATKPISADTPAPAPKPSPSASTGSSASTPGSSEN